MISNKKFLSIYGLKKKKICKIDLRNVYLQQRPNAEIDDLLYRNGYVDRKMGNSPHCEFARLYVKKGEKWLLLNYKNTRYYVMQCRFKKCNIGSIKRFITLCKSINKGYLKGMYKRQHPILLDIPFAGTRYGRDVTLLSPEVFSGHHRIGILIALKVYFAKVIVAKDVKPNTKKCYGKIHHLCKEPQ